MEGLLSTPDVAARGHWQRASPAISKTERCRRRLAQELRHVVQQSGRAPRPQDKLQLDLPRDRSSLRPTRPCLRASPDRTPKVCQQKGFVLNRKIPDTFSASPACSGTPMHLRRSTRATVPLRRRIMPLYSFVLRLLERAKYIMFATSTEMQKAGKTLFVLIIGLPALQRWKKIRWKDRPELYDLMYSLRWGDAVTNNYGFAPAETDKPERFQLQLYAELIKLLAGFR